MEGKLWIQTSCISPTNDMSQFAHTEEVEYICYLYMHPHCFLFYLKNAISHCGLALHILSSGATCIQNIFNFPHLCKVETVNLLWFHVKSHKINPPGEIDLNIKRADYIIVFLMGLLVSMIWISCIMLNYSDWLPPFCRFLQHDIISLFTMSDELKRKIIHNPFIILSYIRYLM